MLKFFYFFFAYIVISFVVTVGVTLNILNLEHSNVFLSSSPLVTYKTLWLCPLPFQVLMLKNYIFVNHVPPNIN